MFWFFLFSLIINLVPGVALYYEVNIDLDLIQWGPPGLVFGCVILDFSLGKFIVLCISIYFNQLFRFWLLGICLKDRYEELIRITGIDLKHPTPYFAWNIKYIRLTRNDVHENVDFSSFRNVERLEVIIENFKMLKKLRCLAYYNPQAKILISIMSPVLLFAVTKFAKTRNVESLHIKFKNQHVSNDLIDLTETNISHLSLSNFVYETLEFMLRNKKIRNLRLDKIDLFMINVIVNTNLSRIVIENFQYPSSFEMFSNMKHLSYLKLSNKVKHYKNKTRLLDLCEM